MQPLSTLMKENPLIQEKPCFSLPRILSIGMTLIFGLGRCGVNAELQRLQQKVKAVCSKEGAPQPSISAFFPHSISLGQEETYEQIAKQLAWCEPILEKRVDHVFESALLDARIPHLSEKNLQKVYEKVSPKIRIVFEDKYINFMAPLIKEVNFSLDQLLTFAEDPLGKRYFSLTHKRLKALSILYRQLIDDKLWEKPIIFDISRLSKDIEETAKSILEKA